MAKAITLNIDEFKSTVPVGKNDQKLDFALQSFAKRNFYAHIYFDEFMTASQYIGVERIDSSGNLRNRFEAYATAYIANIHAMVDSFPYVIYLVLGPLNYVDAKGEIKKITSSNSNWSDNFYKSLLNSNYQTLPDMFLSVLRSDDDFALLRSLSNNHKHKFLTRIVNDAKRLRYEVINASTGKISHIDVKKFFVRIHNKLLPKIFKLYQELQICARN